MKSLLFALLLLTPSSFFGTPPKSTWRSATPEELQSALPARAQVEKERIETEMRTASGIIDSRGKIIAGVVLITAGYSADGKYSHYFLVQSPITIGDISLPTGNYVLGWQRGDNSLIIKFYDAATGDQRGITSAHRLATGSRVESFRIWPPSTNPFIQIGRFAVPYALDNQDKQTSR
jgi:WD40 repeat protein